MQGNKNFTHFHFLQVLIYPLQCCRKINLLYFCIFTTYAPFFEKNFQKVEKKKKQFENAEKHRFLKKKIFTPLIVYKT